MSEQKILTVKIPAHLHRELMQAIARRIAKEPAKGCNKSAFIREALLEKLLKEPSQVLQSPEATESVVVDRIDASVDRVVDESVHYRFQLHGKEYGATMDRGPFAEAGADVLGARVSLLTVKTGKNPSPSMSSTHGAEIASSLKWAMVSGASLTRTASRKRHRFRRWSF